MNTISDTSADTGDRKTNIKVVISEKTVGDQLLNSLAEKTYVMDIDGNAYETVKIGNQQWTIENLKVTRLNDGTAIPLVTDSTVWYKQYTRSSKPAYCWYNNNQDKWGALYNWHVVGTGKLAPEGWRVPTDADWDTLKTYLTEKYGYLIAKHLASKTDWLTCKATGVIGNDLKKNNTTGFSALPGGACNGWGVFRYLGEVGKWWSATGAGTGPAWYRSLTYHGNGLNRTAESKGSGYSVRLVRDIDPDTLIDISTSGDEIMIIGTVSDDQNNQLSDVKIYTFQKKYTLSLPLPCYQEPNAKSTQIVVPQLPVGSYTIIETKPNYPDNKSDYAKIKWTGVPSVDDGEGWIRSRSGKITYAAYVWVQDDQPIGFTNDHGEYSLKCIEGIEMYVRFVKDNYFDSTLVINYSQESYPVIMRKTASPTIKESVITDHIQYFSGFGYILSKYIRKSDGSIEKDKKGKDKTDGTIAKYPKVWKERNLNIINDACVLQNENEKYNNCCTFTNALLILSFKYALGEALNWTKDDHKPWMLDSITRNTRMDVYNGVISKGIGELYQKVEDGDSVNPDAEPVNWCLVQGYKNAKSSDSWAKGHSFLILDYNKTSDRVLILESNGSNPAIDVYNEANAGNGPRFGKIGHIDLFKNGIRPYSPGSAWYLNSLKTSTWEEIKTKYKYRVLIRLFVNELKWFV